MSPDSALVAAGTLGGAQPTLAAALVEAGAVPHAVAAILAGGEAADAGVALLNALLANAAEAARSAAAAAGGAAALGAAVLSVPEPETRAACATALGALTQGDWEGVYEKFGWPVLLVTMQLTGSEALQALAMDAARGAAALLAQPLPRQALGADLQALPFCGAPATLPTAPSRLPASPPSPLSPPRPRPRSPAGTALSAACLRQPVAAAWRRG